MTISRNDPCPCGSGKKYKKCCELREKSKKINAVKLESGSLNANFSNKMGSLFHRNVSEHPIQESAKSKEKKDLLEDKEITM